VKKDMAKKAVEKVREFDVIFEKDESGYVVAFAPELPGCHTQGRTLREAAGRIKEAIRLYLETAAESKARASRQKFIGIRRIGVPVPV
jgi:predicted RNase H-like HicB family nuclease